MPELVCPSCGKRIYASQPLDSLFDEERRCPRCGAALNPERRQVERRDSIRRQNAEHDPGPPSGVERRGADRRKGRRRQQAGGDARPRSDWGWND